ncbi:MAG: CAP domain-containing protein, partial [Hyphomicrobiales bacterium]
MPDVYLYNGESIADISFTNARFFGTAGAESVGLTAGASGALFDQNIEKITFTALSTAYAYQQQGNQLVVFNGASKVATIAVQGDADGTQVQFADKLASVKVSAAGMTIGDVKISSTAPSPITAGSGASTGPSPAPSAQEQLYLELLNDTRLNPMLNASRYLSSYTPLTAKDAQIQNAIDYFAVVGADLQAAYQALMPVAPLAWNSSLAAAAQKHNAALIAADEQSHQVAGELSLGDRLKAEGYNFTRAGENVYSYAQSVIHGHAGFMIDWGEGPSGMQSPAGHRNNIMSANLTEVGIAVTAETNAATKVGPWVVTQDLGGRTGKVFVTGVAYNDTNGDKFYSVGE